MIDKSSFKITLTAYQRSLVYSYIANRYGKKLTRLLGHAVCKTCQPVKKMHKYQTNK